MTTKKEKLNEKGEANAREITDTTSWNRIRSELFPITMFRKLPDTELESCDLLIDAIANSNNCYPMEGDVVAKFGDNFELVFRVQRTLDRRFGFDRSALYLNDSMWWRRRPIILEIRYSSPSFRDLVVPFSCVWAEDGEPHGTVMRDCAGFVQWAELGFPGLRSDATSMVSSRIRLQLDLLEYSMLTHFREIVDRVRVQTFHMSWDAVFETYELANENFDESEFECLVRRTILGWMLFPDKRPFPCKIDEMDSDEIVGMLIEESTNGDRRYQNGRHDNHG